MNLMGKYTNTKNNLQWSRQNPHLLHEISLHDMKVGVLYIPHVRKITGSVLYAEMITSESGREPAKLHHTMLLKLTTVRKVATDIREKSGPGTATK